MHLLLSVAGRELRRQWSRWFIPATIGVVAILASLSTLIGLRSQAVQTGRYTQLLQQVVQAQVRPGGVAMGWQMEPALRVVRPPSPAASVVRGVDGSSPAYWDFGPGGVLPSAPTALHDADDVSPAVDVEFLIRVLLGLLTLAMATQAHAMLQPRGELEGITRFPINQRSIWIGQAAGSALFAFTGWAIVAGAVIGTALAVAPDPTSSHAVVLTVVRMTIPSLAYLTMMVGIGSVIAVSLSATQSRSVAVLLVWLIVCNLAPTVLLSIARVVHPVSSMLAMTTTRDVSLATELRAGELELGSVLATRNVQASTLGDPFDEDRYPELEPIWIAHVRDARHQAETIEGVWRREEDAHDRWIDRVEWLSPASLYWRAASDAAGTGRVARQTWDVAIRSYAEVLRRSLFDDRPRVNPRMPGGDVFAMVRHSIPAIRNLPVFDSADIATTAIADLAVPVGILWGYAAAFMILSTVMFLRVRH